MKKLFSTILVLGLLLSGNAYAHNEDKFVFLICETEGYSAYWEQNTLVIHLLEPKTNFRSLGSSICRGGAQYYQVEKNYKIRFINHYNNSEVLSLFRCTPDV